MTDSSSPGAALEAHFRSMEDIEREAPSSITRATLWVVAVLCAAMLIWANVGHLDIIASAEGRLVPQTFVKIVQPADAGVVKDILVQEGQRVEAGQVLLRMDAQLSDVDEKAIKSELANKTLLLRRIDAELAGRPMLRLSQDPADLFAQINAQYHAHRQSFSDTLNQEQQVLQKAHHELTSSQEVLRKLQQSVPMLQQQAQSYAEMGKDGYAAGLLVQDKQREYLEREQDLRAQTSTVEGLKSAVKQSQTKLEQIRSNYNSGLQNERVEVQSLLQKVQQEWGKQQHKAALLELKAPQTGFVKDLATHSKGTVLAPGTIVLTLVPEKEPLVAEILIKNDDVGFIHIGQNVRIKLVAYPFQKYGMLDGEVIHLGADAQDAQSAKDTASKDKPAWILNYKAMIRLNTQVLTAQGEALKLVPGMQVVAEINQGRRTVLEYLLSPVQKAFHESARER
jgi:hemolysin D